MISKMYKTKYLKFFTLKSLAFILFNAVIFSGCNSSNTTNEAPIKKGAMSLQDRMDLAYQQEFEMTKDLTTNAIPKERLAAAADYIESQRSTIGTEALTNWVERGPNNVAGRVRAILIDKTDGTGNTVFVGSVGGGLWKTTNFKTTTPTWAIVGGLTANLSISVIAQDPTTPATLYVGTGEGFGNFDAIAGGGVFKSTDNGSTWTSLSSTFGTTASGLGINSQFYNINDIRVADNGHVYVASSGFYCNNGGVWKSKDGGGTFSRVLASSGTTCANWLNAKGNDVQIAANGDVFVTVGLGASAKAYVSKVSSYTAATVGDLGNFTDITPSGTFTRIELRVAPSLSTTIYAVCSNGNSVLSIQKSINSGTAWTLCANPNSTSNGSTQNFASAQAWYAIAFAVDPLNADNIVVGGLDLCRSRNGGTSFEQISIWSGFSPPSPLTYANNYVHADHHIIVYQSGSSSNVIFGNDGGVAYSSNMNNAIGIPPTMTIKNTGLNITQYYGADYMPTTGSSYVLAGAQDNGTQKLTNAAVGAGSTVTGGDGAFTHIDQTNGAIQISGYVYNRYSISTNSGASFPGFTQYGTADQGRFINPTDYDDDNNILYTSTTAGSYGRLSSVGSSNTYTTVSVTGMTGQVSTIKVDPNTPTTVFVAANSGATPQIYKVTNANTASPTFTAIPITGTGAPTAGAYLSCIDVEIGNSLHLLATCSNYGQVSVWESINGGTSWTNVEGNLPDMPIRWCAFVPAAYSPGSRGMAAIGGVYLATEMGVWSTTALTGATTNWVQNATNMGNVRVDMVKVRPVDGFVIAVTHGRGIFSYTQPSVVPINLTSFTAKKIQNSALLNWDMAQQDGIQKYELQWSEDGLHFKSIADVAVVSNQLKYQYTHNNLQASNYYRIKFIEMSGEIDYSKIRFIDNGNRKKVDVFPNPFVETITLRALEVGSKVNIYNARGSLLYNKIATSAVENINTKNYPAGVYFVKVFNENGSVFSQQIIK